MRYNRLIAVLLAVFILAGCSAPASLTSTFAFPDTEWNLSPEALISALKLDDEEIVKDSFADDYAQYQTVSVKNLDVFGASATVMFRFVDLAGDGTYGLHYIRVLYPEGTDMDSIRSKLTETYGASMGFEATKYDAEYRAHVSRWESGETVYEALSDEQLRSLDSQYLEESKDVALCNIMWSDEPYRIITGSADNWEQDWCCGAVTFYCALAEIPGTNE